MMHYGGVGSVGQSDGVTFWLIVPGDHLLFVAAAAYQKGTHY